MPPLGLQGVDPKVLLLLEASSSCSFFPQGPEMKTEALWGMGRWEMGLPGQGHQELLRHVWFPVVSLGVWWTMCKFSNGLGGW